MRSLNFSLVVLFFTLTLLSCERIDLNEEFSARVGDKFRVDSDLSFSIDSVNDYRCPLLFECIWSGDVKMFCKFHEGSHQVDSAIYLINNERNPIRIGGYSIKLLSVDPQSQRGETIPQIELEISIIVKKD
jgi:hypothetical protein